MQLESKIMFCLSDLRSSDVNSSKLEAVVNFVFLESFLQSVLIPVATTTLGVQMKTSVSILIGKSKAMVSIIF